MNTVQKNSKIKVFKHLLILVFASLFINIYTFTSLSHLFKPFLNGQLFVDFDKLTTYEDYLFLMRFILYFITSAISGIAIYFFSKSYKKEKSDLNEMKLIIALAIVILIVFSASAHIILFEITGTDLLLTETEYYFRRIMWYTGRTLSIAIIALYIVNNELKTIELINNEEKINALTHENYKNKFQSLKLKISPYFIFNTFMLIEKSLFLNKEKSLNTLFHFSNILRNSLNNNELISLQKDIEILNNYYYIMKQKHPNISLSNLIVNNDNSNLQIPQFTLLILIENSIKFLYFNGSCNITIELSDNTVIIRLISDSIELKNQQSFYTYITQLNERSIVTLNKEIIFIINDKEHLFKIPLKTK